MQNIGAQGHRQLLTTWGGGLICGKHSIRSNTAGGLGGTVSPPPPSGSVMVHLDHSLFLEKSEVHSGRQKIERKEETKTLCDHLGQKNILNSLKKIPIQNYIEDYCLKIDYTISIKRKIRSS